jgi:hypothetical protein
MDSIQKSAQRTAELGRGNAQLAERVARAGKRFKTS